ncbi:MAG: hypothetical protein HWN67_03340 [Candidatus Helarchaeota archaeon]|nr:hypothetical protein [Candidatus Helarchaeota archaeon]
MIIANLNKFYFLIILMLRFDGIYQYKYRKFTQYFRFYDDGTVIAVKFHISQFQMRNWLKKDEVQIGISKGKYNIKDEEIRFSLKKVSFVYNYIGEIDEKSLNITKYEDKNYLGVSVFKFIPDITPSKENKPSMPYEV